MVATYTVVRNEARSVVDAEWDKAYWDPVQALTVNHAHIASSVHRPLSRVKLCYNESALHVIFQIQQDFLHADVTTQQGEVWHDSCVEFFFAPYEASHTAYYNLEINCCGVLRMMHQKAPHQNLCFVKAEACRCIEVTSSVPDPGCIDSEKPTTWILEYRLPWAVFENDPAFIRPAPGVTWRGNFYKCADASVFPHWISWSPVLSEQPDFHRPDNFGTLTFV